MSTPQVSVCIPSYNIEKYIDKTIESVLSQTYEDFELVIVDDNSNDKTLDVIKRYNDDRIRLIINQVNLGPQENWNKALKEAKGRYIKILCHDDILYTSCLQSQVEVLQNPRNTRVTIVCSGRDIIDASGRKILKRHFPRQRGVLLGKDAIKKIVRYGANPIGEPTAVLFRSEILNKIGYFCGSIPYIIDLDYWCRILLYGNLYVIPESLCAFRFFSKAWSAKIGYLQISHFIQFIDKLNKDNRYELKQLDCNLGRLRAILNGIARNLFYIFFLKAHS